MGLRRADPTFDQEGALVTEALIERVAERFIAARAAEAALVLDRVDEGETARALVQLPASLAVQSLHHMGADIAARVLSKLPIERAQELTRLGDPVRMAGILALVPEETKAQVLAGLSARLVEELSVVLDFPPGTAGQLMDARVVAFRDETLVEHVIARVRAIHDRRVLDVLICDDEGRLSGMVSLQALLNGAADAPVGSLARPDVPSVHPMASRDEVVELVGRYALATLPVVDLDRKVIGVLRYDALVRAAQHAATDDLQQMVGAGKEERALSSPLVTVKSRLPWLVINLLTAFTAASVVGLFDETIAKFTALAVLLPIVAGQSGNTGAQALAVTSRGLALREIRVAHSLRVLRKEVSAALVNGVVCGGLTATGVLVWSGSAGLSFVIGVSMLTSMLLAAAAGALVPLVLTALGRDPATASSIILTTVTDVTGFFSFLGLASWAARSIGL
jgi:magnesium transporter